MRTSVRMRGTDVRCAALLAGNERRRKEVERGTAEAEGTPPLDEERNIIPYGANAHG